MVIYQSPHDTGSALISGVAALTVADPNAQPANQTTSSPSFVDPLPPYLCTRVAQLQDLQRQQDIIHTKLQREVQALRKQYWLQYNPLYQQRFEIITGHTGPSQGPEPLGIPDFWLAAMKNHPDIGLRINGDGDERALKYLTNIQVEHLEDFDFALVFHFAQNEFFSNSALRATFFYQKVFTGNRPDPLEAKGDHIDWKPGKQLTAHRGGNKDADEEDASGSFFDFLSPTAVPAEGGEEEIREREFLLWIDFELAEQFQKELVPRAVEWYTGDARSEDEDWDEDENDEEDEDREGDEDSEDDSEDEEDAENSDDSSRQPRQRRQLQMPQRRR